jgi:cupin 2 domain-containing protein
MNAVKNIFADIPEKMEGEWFETILRTSLVRIERIVSRGHSSAEGIWYDQEDDEWVLLLKGSAGLRFEDEEEVAVLSPGHYLRIDKYRRHRVEWTDPSQETIWLTVHCTSTEA